VRRGFILFGKRAADFTELFHQIVAGVDTAGGVADEELGAIGDGFLVGVKTNGRRVCIGVSFDYRDLQSLAPALELLDGGGAKGIGSSEAYRVAAFGEPEGELGGGGRFSGAIDTYDENDKRFSVGTRGGGEEIRIEFFSELAAGGFDHLIGGNLSAEAAEFFDDRGGEPDADIGADEIGFEFIPIDFRAIGDFVKE